MGEEKREVSIGFKIFVYTTQLIITFSILGGAWLLDKTLLAPPLIISFRLCRLEIEKKFSILHMATVYSCMILSIIICDLGLYISLPIGISLISNVIVGTILALFTWYFQEYIDFKNSVTEEENFIRRCKDLGYNEMKTQIAIKFFIEKQTPKDVWYWLQETQENPVEWDSVRKMKYRMKKDLFG